MYYSDLVSYAVVVGSTLDRGWEGNNDRGILGRSLAIVTG